MGVILDTSILVDVERGLLSPAEVHEATQGEPVFLTPVTIGEMRHGLMYAKTEAQRKRREAALAETKAVPCIPIDRETGDMFGEIAARLDKKGRPSKHRAHDLWIASVALQHGHSVLTRNRRDFEDIPGLTVLSI